jgi:integrase
MRITMPDGSRRTFLLGHAKDGWTWEDAQEHLDDVLTKLGRGEQWPPSPDTPDEEATIGEYLQELVELHPHIKNTDDWNWRIEHLQPFADKRPSQVTAVMAMRYRAALLKGHVAPNVDVSIGEQDSPIGKPAANSSINKFLAMLRRALRHVRIVHGFGPGDAAVPSSLYLKESARPPVWLERDEARSFLQAAQHLDRWPHWTVFQRAQCVRALRDDAQHWKLIAAQQGQAIATVWRQHYLLEQADADSRTGEAEAMAIVLLAGGLRGSEVGRLDIQDVDTRHGRVNVHGTKTPNAERTPEMPPRSMRRLESYISARPDGDTDEALFVTRNGRRRNRYTVRSLVKRIATRAQQLADEGLLAPINDIERLTTHDLRRTYVALLFARTFDLAFVQRQVGHTPEDINMTAHVYNKALQIDRSANWNRVEDDLLGPEERTDPETQQIVTIDDRRYVIDERFDDGRMVLCQVDRASGGPALHAVGQAA